MYQTPPPYADNTYSSMPYPPNGSYSAPKPNKGKLIAILGICGGVLAIGIVILILVLTNGNKGSNGSGGGGGGNNGEISTQSSIVGTWEDGSGGYTFNGDGTGSTFTFGGDGSVKFNYTINGDNITIRVEEDNFNFTSGYSVSGNTLTLNYPDGRTAKYNKKDTSANNNNNTGTADPALLVGTWEYSMDEDFALCYIFNADNTGTFIFVGDEMPMTYETNGNKLACTISYSGSYTKVDEYTYSISGDTLSLTDLEYGLTMKYTKK
jgi:hypothetical protein